MSIRYTTPEVFILAEPKLNWDQAEAFLRSAYPSLSERDAHTFITQRQLAGGNDCDLNTLAEMMSRLCYRSFDVSLNPNLSRVRPDQASHIANLLAVRHMAIFEHLHISFVFTGVSRVFTHELVRHRIAAYSQESLRYVRLDEELPFRSTPIESAPSQSVALDLMVAANNLLTSQQKFVSDFVSRFGLNNQSADFHWKKTITSALRRWVGMGVASNIGATWNITQLRHIIEQRTAPEAEEEIRSVFRSLAEVCIARWPLLFGDFREMPSGRFRAVPPVDEELVNAWLWHSPENRVKLIRLVEAFTSDYESSR